MLRVIAPLPGRLLGIDRAGHMGADLERLLTQDATPPHVLVHCLCEAP
jgi:hypothetical protein